MAISVLAGGLAAEIVAGAVIGLLVWRRWRASRPAAPDQDPVARGQPPELPPSSSPDIALPAADPLPAEPEPPETGSAAAADTLSLLAADHPPSATTPQAPSDPPPDAPPVSPASASADEVEDETLIEDARMVVPTPLTLVWGRLGLPPERYVMLVDQVSRDQLAFGGTIRRLDLIQIIPVRRLFHTLQLPQERLLAVHDDQDRPIADIRAWLAALPACAPDLAA